MNEVLDNMGLFDLKKNKIGTPLEQNKEVIEASNGEITFTFVSLDMESVSHCKQICPDRNECKWYLGNLRNGSISTDFILSTVHIIISNETNNSIEIEYENFKAVDIDGFTYSCVELCNDYSFNHSSKNYLIPPLSKAKFDILFSNVENRVQQINYTYETDKYENRFLALNIEGQTSNITKELAYRETIEKLKKTIENLEKQIDTLNEKAEEDRDTYQSNLDRYRESYNNKNQETKSLKQRMSEDTLIQYEIIEDDDYWKIISLEENDTISFNREFDKSKENHNWINASDPLVTLKVDNVVWGLNAPTIIKSPVFGIFECISNKMIQYNEEICRIRKYNKEDKEHIIEELEREEIKQAVLKKERKKIIERQTLDELIDEGKVFNVYTKKDGNRTTIPMDIASAVWNRDGGKCCICGSKKELEFDHIIPLSKGGATTFRNLQLLCKNCNIRKSDII